MQILFILNEGPYGSELSYNALRMATNLQKKEIKPEVNIFLLGDGVSCAAANQETPKGYYNLEKMFNLFLKRGGTVKACGTCIDARGIESNLIKGVEKSTMEELTQWTLEADKVLNF